MKDLIYDFLNYEKNVLGRTQDHLKHHKYCLLQFRKFAQTKQKKIDEIKVGDVHDYLIHIKTTPILFGPNQGRIRGQNTLSGYANSLKQFFKRYRSLGYNGLNREQIPNIQKERKTLDRLRPDEYEIFKQAPRLYEKNIYVQKRNQLLIDIPRYTGLRRAELLRTTFENFQMQNNQFEILGKGGYVDGVCFTNELRFEVYDYFETIQRLCLIPKENLIFFSLSNNNFLKKMSEKSVNLIFNKYSKLLLRDGLLKRMITPHMERHSFATNCVLSGLSQQATTKLMRHRNPTTTLRYYHLDNKRIKSEFDKIKFT